jgi:23S rRNA maturation-related 3'-5' exoribonuclease YhaM
LSSTSKSATNHDTTERHAQTKSEIAEAIEKYVFNFQLYFIKKITLIVSNNIELSISL